MRRTLTAEPMESRWATSGRRHVPLVIREPEASWWVEQARTSVTVAAIREGDAGWHPERVVSHLAAVAADDELLVVFGSHGQSRQHALITGLRRSVPGCDVVPVPVRHRHGRMLHDAATVERLLDAGHLPVVVTPVNALHDVTAEIASYLRADRVLRVLQTSDGAELHQVWHRAAAQAVI